MTKTLFAVLVLVASSTLVCADDISPMGVWDHYKHKNSVSSKALVIPNTPEIVRYPNTEVPGTVIVRTGLRKLYLTIDRVNAYEYPIAVGREGFAWTGTEIISKIEEWPDWVPPKEMHQRRPELPERVVGGINNPLGAVAIYLGNSLYRIHGTNDPKSIGKAESSGCFRMTNEQVIHLASLVKIGTTVKVLES
jgi:lipoprotein-anchoring transpeptidase ErfK/SrfK